jgi:putative endonuclease
MRRDSSIQARSARCPGLPAQIPTFACRSCRIPSPTELVGRRSVVDMPVDNRARLGRLGERLALEHYVRLGFHLLERNYRVRGGELDLIVYDGRTVVFAEVKTRRAGGWDPLESITQTKQRRLRMLAASWLSGQARPPGASELRFDAVGILVDARGRLVELDQREDAF